MDFKTAYLFMQIGYRIRIKQWKENTYWQIVEGDVIEINQGIAHGIPDVNICTLRFICMDNWEVIPRFKSDGTEAYLDLTGGK